MQCKDNPYNTYTQFFFDFFIFFWFWFFEFFLFLKNGVFSPYNLGLPYPPPSLAQNSAMWRKFANIQKFSILKRTFIENKRLKTYIFQHSTKIHTFAMFFVLSRCFFQCFRAAPLFTGFCFNVHENTKYKNIGMLATSIINNTLL